MKEYTKKKVTYTFSGNQMRMIDTIKNAQEFDNNGQAIKYAIREVYLGHVGVQAVRPVGRPRHDDTRAINMELDEPMIYAHPDNVMHKNEMLTITQLEDWYALRGEAMPDDI